MPYLHHQPFWLGTLVDFPNSDFTDTNITWISATVFEINGWEFYLKQTKLNGRDSIAGKLTPTDPTGTGNSASVDTVTKKTTTTVWTFSYEFTSSLLPPGFAAPQKSVRLYTANNVISPAYGILRGPYMVSKQAVLITAGSIVRFWYKGDGGEDAYDIFGYLLNTDTGSTVTLVNRSGTDATGETPWTEVAVKVVNTGTYKFVFINGSWDFTGGTVTGASMYICGVRVQTG